VRCGLAVRANIANKPDESILAHNTSLTNITLEISFLLHSVSNSRVQFNRPMKNKLEFLIQSMNAFENVTRTASGIYLENIGIQMVIRIEDSPTNIINEK
jgi:predicted house-cleaning NTP pyrophosphatase (Maf/HAM1 superfamily)